MDLNTYRLPVGTWVDTAVDWMTDNLEWLFDAISTFLKALIDGLESGLLWPSALVVVAIVAVAPDIPKGWGGFRPTPPALGRRAGADPPGRR